MAETKFDQRSGAFELRDRAVARLIGAAVDEAAGALDSDMLFSLRCDGVEIRSDRLEKNVVKSATFPGGELLEVTAPIGDAGLQLRMEIKVFKDFPVVEYHPFLENTGTAPSGLIEDFRSLDFAAELPQPGTVTISRDSSKRVAAGGYITVRYSLGSLCVPSDFVPQRRELWSRPGDNRLSLRSAEGRSSASYLPFFGVDVSARRGFNVGVGWSGAWRADFEVPVTGWRAPAGERYRVSSGMNKVRFRVLPGESLRQPAIFIQFRDGLTVRDGQNELRRFMRAFHAPHDSKGKLLPPPLSLVTWGGLSSQRMLDRLRAAVDHDLPYEVFWIDAGWSGYDGPCPHFLDAPSDWPQRVGHWRVNRYPHPGGLRPVSDEVRQAGMKFLAWFEPERIHAQSRGEVLTAHPEWLISLPGEDSRLLNLGIPEARQWIGDTLIRFLRDEGIDIYRQDFNMDPIPYWAAVDAPDRVGVAEMKHIDGLYRLWERLHQEFPDMLFDTCSSGGRRLDFMLLTYSVPLCQSDYACFPDYDREAVQTENQGLNEWIPMHTGFSWHPQHDSYNVLSCAGVGSSVKIWQFDSLAPTPDHDWDDHRRMLREILRMREIQLRADFYPLTGHPENTEAWCASQFHVPEEDRGLVLAFRRERSDCPRMVFPLSGVDSGADYELEFATDGRREELSGAQLASGLTVELAAPRSVELIYYRKIDA